MELIRYISIPHPAAPCSSSTKPPLQTSISSLRRNWAPNNHTPFSNHLISFAIALTLNSPSPSYAIPYPNSPPPPSPTTPFSQSKNLQIGLENGRIRPCPSTNPGCVSTNPKSSSFAFPWRIPHPEDAPVMDEESAVRKLEKNPEIRVVENRPSGGRYLEAEVDGFYGKRDVLEFLVKGDVVTYRCVAKNVTFVYPFTTAIGDSKGQMERLDQIVNQLGWFALTFDSMG
ncbi:Thylakoid lumenal 17.9 kDa protein, chloroplastic [Linum grandiflorum]